MKLKTLEIDINHRVAVVWLARDDVRNAFNEVSIAELAQAFTELGRNDDVRAIVLAAKGPAFCAGRPMQHGATREVSAVVLGSAPVTVTEFSKGGAHAYASVTVSDRYHHRCFIRICAG